MLEAERAARIEAQRTARMKDEFLATLSHELRTRLNAILGWTQLLRQPGGGSQDVQRGLEVIDRKARAQVQLVDDLLDLSRILASQARLDLQRITLVEVTKGAVESAAPAAHSKGVRLKKMLDPRGSGAPHANVGDRLRHINGHTAQVGRLERFSVLQKIHKARQIDQTLDCMLD